MKLTIGISGVARSGKDTFCALLIEELAKRKIHATRFALADKLKTELAPVIKQFYGLDIFNCTPQEKEQLRDLMVFHGKMRRLTSKGTHWTSQIEPIIRYGIGVGDVAIVTDIRYDVFPEDELPWLKKKMGGLLVHVSRFYMESNEEDDDGNPFPVFIQPPNKDEAENDPKIKSQADYRVEWQTGDIEKFCRPEVVKFIDFLDEKGYKYH